LPKRTGKGPLPGLTKKSTRRIREIKKQGASTQVAREKGDGEKKPSRNVGGGV